MKNRRLKVMLLPILFIIPLMLVTIKTMYSSPNPPSGDFHWMGPAVIADITFRPATPEEIIANDCTDDGVVFMGEFKCKGQTIELETYYGGCGDFTYTDIDEESLKNFMFDPEDFLSGSDCIPDNKNIQGIAVQTVIKYEESVFPEYKKATVILLFIVPKGK